MGPAAASRPRTWGSRLRLEGGGRDVRGSVAGVRAAEGDGGRGVPARAAPWGREAQRAGRDQGRRAAGPQGRRARASAGGGTTPPRGCEQRRVRHSGVRRSSGCGVAEENGGRLSSQGGVCGDRRCHLTALGLRAAPEESPGPAGRPRTVRCSGRRPAWPWTVGPRPRPARLAPPGSCPTRLAGDPADASPAIQWTPRRRSSGWTRRAPAQSPPRSPPSRPPARRCSWPTRAGPAGPRGRSVFRRP